MQGFGLTIEELDAGAIRIALRGELDLAHAYTFDEELRRVEDGPPVRASCSTCASCASSTRAGSRGCSPLAAARASSGIGCCLVRGPKAIQRLFALSAVDEAFEMVNEVPVALAGTASSLRAPSDRPRA